jgi:O-acetyl-ADP-ribose deacetylase (regulator of RNase III)
MKILYTTGDLLDSPERVIAHGCNTKGSFGAGIAKQIADRAPEVKAAYKAFAPYQLGCVQAVAASSLGNRLVYNLMTQVWPGRDARLSAISVAFTNMANSLPHAYDRMGIPRIGCGIGGLHWDQVQGYITMGIENSDRPDLTIVVYDLPTR